jgi:hypothetical protein
MGVFFLNFLPKQKASFFILFSDSRAAVDVIFAKETKQKKKTRTPTFLFFLLLVKTLFFHDRNIDKSF